MDTAAATGCGKESAADCFKRLLVGTGKQKLQTRALPAEAVEDTEEVTAIASGHLARMNTGAQSLAAGGTPSTTDYASDFIALLESSGFGDRKGDTLTFHWDFPLRAAADKKRVKISVALTDPKLDPKAAAALTGDDLAKATGSLDQLDNVTYGASWAFMKRDPKPNATAVTLMREHVKSEFAAIQTATARRLDATYGVFPGSSDRTVSAEEMTPVVQLAVREARAEAERAAFDAIDYVARVTADAADEQKQLSGQITYHERAALIGAKEIGASLTYEMPTKKTATQRLASLSNLSNFREMVATNEDATPAGATTPKFTFKAEYKQLQRRTLPPPAALSTLNKPSAHSLSVSAVAGWKFSTIAPDRDGAIDFNGTFENDSSDPKKKNRLIATLTFTQQLSDHFAIPIALRYASHESDLADINKRFSAHFGVSYKIPPVNPAQKTAELARRLVSE